MKICTVIGARPQFIKAAAVSSVIARNSEISEVIIHTGQHYDPDMSDIFFSQLGIPKEKYNLNIGSGNHGAQTGRMLSEIENVLTAEKPDRMLVYGDTNSTVAAALAAVKLHIPTAHVEAGMRSFNREMPEEINRVVSDHISDINFCSTLPAVKNLENEGRGQTAILVGDVMYDCALKFSDAAEKNCDPFSKFAIRKNNYILMTCHRPANTDSRENLSQIVHAANDISEICPVLYPIHPRTKKYIAEYGLSFSQNVKIVSPLSYFDMLLAERYAKLILTDSGGIQKEAFFYQVPCVTMREETEWVETVEMGWNVITGADYGKIMSCVKAFLSKKPPYPSVKPYGNGDASEKIVKHLLNSRDHV
ncbi:MAG: UDP-N-acetylglucosamine 2-epimerase [Lentisphaerae bacterium GWF2_45_14]|nr:MAG: UDP-N-acetylglucosamine 2-epimerase [Lentisphaerae bacterium GWF2_45_14]